MFQCKHVCFVRKTRLNYYCILFFFHNDDKASSVNASQTIYLKQFITYICNTSLCICSFKRKVCKLKKTDTNFISNTSWEKMNK